MWFYICLHVTPCTDTCTDILEGKLGKLRQTACSHRAVRAEAEVPGEGVEAGVFPVSLKGLRSLWKI